MDEPHGTALRIFLAEDDDDLRAVVAQALRSDGHEVVEASHGGTVWTFIDDCMLHDALRPRIDVLVTDLHMPQIGGLAVLEHLRELNWELPTVVITAYADAEVYRRTAELDVAVLPKPFAIEDLRRVVADAHHARDRSGAASAAG